MQEKIENSNLVRTFAKRVIFYCEVCLCLLPLSRQPTIYLNAKWCFAIHSGDRNTSNKPLKWDKFVKYVSEYLLPSKGQTKSKWFFQADVSSKTRTIKFDFTTYYETSGWCVFVRFLEEIEDTKKTFRNYLTFRRVQLLASICWLRVKVN